MLPHSNNGAMLLELSPAGIKILSSISKRTQIRRCPFVTNGVNLGGLRQAVVADSISAAVAAGGEARAAVAAAVLVGKAGADGWGS